MSRIENSTTTEEIKIYINGCGIGRLASHKNVFSFFEKFFMLITLQWEYMFIYILYILVLVMLRGYIRRKSQEFHSILFCLVKLSIILVIFRYACIE